MLILISRFVGTIDKYLSLLQCETKLYVVNHIELWYIFSVLILCASQFYLSKELFYQHTLRLFANFLSLPLTAPAPVYELALIGLDHPDAGYAQTTHSLEDLLTHSVSLILHNYVYIPY